MSTVALSGDDTINLQNHVFTDLAEGNCVELDFPNDIASVKVGKNGNAVYGLNEMGKVADVKMRLVRGSTDDKFMNNLLSQQNNNFAGTVLLIGQFIKKLGDGAGNVASDTYIMSGGIISKQTPGKMNVEGDAEQSVAVYTMKFSKAIRVIT